MARYAVITDLTRPRTDVAMVAYEVRNDATVPETVELVGTVGFAFVIYDATGAIISETLAQKRNRMKSEFDAYMKRLKEQADSGDSMFDSLRSQAIGYRYPAS